MAQVPQPSEKEPLTLTETRVVPGIAGPVEQEVTRQNPNAKPTGGRYLARNIEEAKKRGASATQILEKLVVENQNHPNFQTINTALQRGASHEAIVEKILEDNRQKNLVERFRGDVERRADRVVGSFQATARGEQTGTEAIFQFGGETAGLAADTIWQGLTTVFNGIEKITPDRFDARVQNTWKKLLDEPLARKGIALLGTGIENYEEWKAKNPNNARAARNIESVLNISEFIPAKKAASLLGRTAKEAGEEIIESGAKKILRDAPNIDLRKAVVEKAKVSQADHFQTALSLTRKQRGQQSEIVERFGRDTGRFMVDEGLQVRSRGGNIDVTDAIDTLDDRIKVSSEALTDLLRYENRYISVEELRARALKNALDAPGFEKIGTDRDKIARLINAEYDSFMQDYSRLGGFVNDAGEVLVPLTGVNNIKQFFWGRTKNFAEPDANLINAANISSGHAMKDTIEELAEGVDVKQANARVSEFYTTKKILEMRNGARLPNGRLGGMMARLTGAVIGSGAGIEGSIAGALTADKVVQLLSDPQVSTSLQRTLIRRLEREGKTDMLQEALQRAQKRREDFFTQGMLLGPGNTIEMPGSAQRFGDGLGTPRGPETNPFRLLPDGQFAEPFNVDDVIEMPPRGAVPRGLGNEAPTPRSVELFAGKTKDEIADELANMRSLNEIAQEFPDITNEVINENVARQVAQELEEELFMREIALEAAQEAITTNPIQQALRGRDRFLFDREGRFVELGDSTTRFRTQFIEDMIREAGYGDPREFMDGYLTFQANRSELASDRKAFKELQKKYKEITKDLPEEVEINRVDTTESLNFFQRMQGRFNRFLDENDINPEGGYIGGKPTGRQSQQLESGVSASLNNTTDLLTEARKYKTADEFVKAQEKPKAGNIKLYRGMEQRFDENYDLTTTDSPHGYSTWTDNRELARQYAGGDGFVYEIELPKKNQGIELLDTEGDRVLFLDNEKPAGLNGVDGKEYLIYTEHDLYDPSSIRETFDKSQLEDIWKKANAKN